MDRSELRVPSFCDEAVVLSLLGLLERPLRGRLACKLSAGHGDRHAAFVAAAQGGDRWRWLCWDTTHRELLPWEPCDRTDEDTADDCVLAAAHPGRHRRELQRSVNMVPLRSEPDGGADLAFRIYDVGNRGALLAA